MNPKLCIIRLHFNTTKGRNLVETPIPFGLLFEEAEAYATDHEEPVYDPSDSISYIILPSGEREPYVTWAWETVTCTKDGKDSDPRPRPVGTGTATKTIENTDKD